MPPHRFDRDTLGDKVYDSIRSMIEWGEISPGARLKENDLAERLGVSTTPVREALRQLARDGLVVKEQYKGAYVHDISESLVEQVYEVREALEQLAVRLACERMLDSDLARLRSVMIEHEEAFRQGDVEALLETDLQLHVAILLAAHNDVLVSLYRQLRGRIYAFIRLDDSTKGRRQESLDDHAELLGALEARNASKARRLISEHILRARGYVLEAVHNMQYQRQANDPALSS